MAKAQQKKEWIIIDLGDVNTTVFKATEDDFDIVMINDKRQNPSLIAYKEDKCLIGLHASSITESDILKTARLIKTRTGEYNDFPCFVKDGDEFVSKKLNSREVIAHFVYDIIEKTKITNILFVHPIYWKPDGNEMKCLKDAFKILDALVENLNHELIDSMSAMAWNILFNNPNTRGKICVMDSGYSHTTASIFDIKQYEVKNVYTAVIDFGGMDITCAVANHVYDNLKNADSKSGKWQDEKEYRKAKEILDIIARQNDYNSIRMHKIFLNEAKEAKEKITKTTTVQFNGSRISTDTDLICEFKFGDIYNSPEFQHKLGYFKQFIDTVLGNCNGNLITTEVRGGNSASHIFIEAMKRYTKKISGVLNLSECIAEGAAKMKNMQLKRKNIRSKPYQNYVVDFVKIQQNPDDDKLIFKKEQPPTAAYQQAHIGRDVETLKKLIEVNEISLNADELANEIEKFGYQANKIDKNLKTTGYSTKRFIELHKRVGELPDPSEDKTQYKCCRDQMEKFKKEMCEEYEQQTKSLFANQQESRQSLNLLKKTQKVHNFFYKTIETFKQPVKVEGIGDKIIKLKNKENDENYKLNSCNNNHLLKKKIDA